MRDPILQALHCLFVALRDLPPDVGKVIGVGSESGGHGDEEYDKLSHVAGILFVIRDP